MSATELIEKVKSLPASEQMVFAEWFHQWETQGNGGGPKLTPRPFQMPDYAGRLQRLFPNDPIPGDPQRFWDELRAERIP